MGHPATDRLRRMAAGLLLAGGVLAFAASFLPLGQIAYPAIADEPVTTFVEVPGQALAIIIQQTAQAPYRLSIDTCLLLVGEWAAPLLLAVIGLSLLIRRQPVSSRLWVSGLLLILSGAGFTVLYCAIYLLFPHGEVIVPKATLDYGPAVTLLGYLIALTGVIGLAVQRPGRTRAVAD